VAREYFAKEKTANRGLPRVFFVELLSIFAKSITFFGRIGRIGSIGCAGCPNRGRREVA
jgi:hypothetical protein